MGEDAREPQAMTRLERITDDILKDYPCYAPGLYTKTQCKDMIKAAPRSALWMTWMGLEEPEEKAKLYMERGEIHEVENEPL